MGCIAAVGCEETLECQSGAELVREDATDARMERYQDRSRRRGQMSTWNVEHERQCVPQSDHPNMASKIKVSLTPLLYSVLNIPYSKSSYERVSGDIILRSNVDISDCHIPSIVIVVHITNLIANKPPCHHRKQ